MLLENQIKQNVIHQIDGSESLAVVTSGSLPPNPAELLGSARMQRILGELGENMDVVVIDSLPSIVADAQVLTAKVDAILLVVQLGKTQKDSIKATVELLTRANARIIGVVINRISRDRGDYYSQYHYQGFDYTLPDDDKQGTRKKTSGNNGQTSRKSIFRRSKPQKE